MYADEDADAGEDARAVDDAASDEGGTRFAMETDFGIDLGMEMKRMQLPTQTQLTTHRKPG